MDHHAGRLYWPTTASSPPSYPALKGRLRVHTAVIGGGMSGAACGLALAQSGVSACLLERGEVAEASTAANTGLLQFANDIMLSDLAGQIGTRDAVHFYKACRDAMRQLSMTAQSLPCDTGFKTRSSLYYASSGQDVPRLLKEYRMLRENGFDVDYWTENDIAARFPFRKPGAIVTHGDAEVNPYRFVIAMTQAACRAGLSVYEHTEVVRHASAGGLHRLEMGDGSVVEADSVIYAVGYEPEELRGRLIKAELNRTFAAVTGVQQSLAPWHERLLIWETARPYLYMRTMPDGRVAIGGLDEKTSRMPPEDSDTLAERARDLQKGLRAHFPMMDAPIEYVWSGVFGESRDNLPFIGRDPAWPGVYYCLGYGGNGTVYSMMAAQMIGDMIHGRRHPAEDILRLDRPTLQRT